jgi:hypothetical protein
MKPIVDYFDRAYIINLKHREDRRRQVTQEFYRIGITVPNNKLLFYDAIRPTDKEDFPSIGVRGCFLSHKNILELASQDDLHSILVFEDDVSFRRVSAQLINEIVSKLKEDDWDLVFFGYARPHDGSVKGPLSRWQGDVLGAHFYGVHGRFIRTMLQYMRDCELRPRGDPQGGPMPADGAYNHVRYVFPDVKLLLPPCSLAHQRNSKTDISPVHLIDKMPLFSALASGLRAVKHRVRMRRDARRLMMSGSKER